VAAVALELQELLLKVHSFLVWEVMELLLVLILLLLVKVDILAVVAVAVEAQALPVHQF
jgi:hypothetical protein